MALPLEEEHQRKARQAETANLSLFQLLFSTMAEFQRTFGPIIAYLVKKKVKRETTPFFNKQAYFLSAGYFSAVDHFNTD